ncbi:MULTISPECIES: YybH family protein [Aquimarina]|uniref:YybH family protein n=1 Tax=Aquimarina TaxID=290174 RepID=UPI00040DC2D9|nr:MULTISPECIES: nuclear transport factor 2 family protein [Aquimarina]
MKSLKTTLTIVCTLFIITSIQSQNKDSEAVASVMKTYKDALQNLTTEGTFELFTKDSKVFESGGVEGTYSHYIEHHLGPELGHFKSFTFSDYEIDVQVDAPYAFTTETYIYTIVLNPDDKGNSRTIKKKGVATSILKKIDGKWKIIKTHSSSRNIK